MIEIVGIILHRFRICIRICRTVPSTNALLVARSFNLAEGIGKPEGSRCQ
jgi:hypothetical protein